MDLLTKVEKLADEFREIDSDLSKYERLKLAIQMQRNELLAEAFCISSTNKSPVALEKIAIELESSAKKLGHVHDSLNEIAQKLEE
ncbi:hypothetical protein [Algoriphagus persicinus]|uniref:hypothetical protein n=1 Tax=Algoriphagus persicinus TaxID=3108754 RepID=UPI002B3BF101|nr:hypothetical protein [Algoriphagus sp. E1-3-M2]MEB2787282.1 hypothetical protein [Algoriphagus sp. E1-3-M2]